MLAGVGRIGRIGGAGSGSAGLTGFVSVWATTGVDETITIPTQAGTFNADVDWGDGTTETITTYNGFSHEYADIGEYTISITGTFPNIYFANVAADRLKIKKVLNLGTVGWTTFHSAFSGCANLTNVTMGSTDASNVSTMYRMFRTCTSLTSITFPATFNASSVTTIQSMVQSCSALTTLDISGVTTTAALVNTSSMFNGCSVLTNAQFSPSFVTSGVNTMLATFANCPALTSLVGVEDWDITGLNSTNDLDAFMNVGSMTTAQYDNLLIKWEAQAVLSGLTPSFGASKYTGGGTAAAARAALESADNWTISDGGTA